MSHDGYKGGATIGGFWGIAAAAIVAAPIFAVQLIGHTMGCEGRGPDCSPDNASIFLPPAIAGLAVFWMVRTLVNFIVRKTAGD